nr:transcription factor myb48 [Quercus suber]
MVQEGIRRGPWTEQEDFKLNCFVGLFGDRRWDFIAKVSGLNRTGKSCRLRWVNYLHPGLKQGKMTPQEERLVLELHSKWGNRWSRIARKLPGRTDNEIKNYWRTHMRKKAQEEKQAMSPSPSSSNCSSSSPSNPIVESLPFTETGEKSFHDAGGPDIKASAEKQVEEEQGGEKGYSMDDIWKDIKNTLIPGNDGYTEEGSSFPCPTLDFPTWDQYHSESPWTMAEENRKRELHQISYEEGA